VVLQIKNCFLLYSVAGGNMKKKLLILMGLFVLLSGLGSFGIASRLPKNSSFEDLVANHAVAESAIKNIR
jgi:hypothetical protein